MQLPREVIVGKGTLIRVTEVTKRLGLTKSALILAGHKSSKIAGNTVQRQLQQAGLTVESLIVETATMQDVTQAEQKTTPPNSAAHDKTYRSSASQPPSATTASPLPSHP